MEKEREDHKYKDYQDNLIDWLLEKRDWAKRMKEMQEHEKAAMGFGQKAKNLNRTALV